MLHEAEEQLKSIIQASKKEALLPHEKEAVKSHVMHFMKEHPVKPKTGLLGWPAMFMSMAHAPAMRYVSLAAMAVLIGGGSVAFAAQHAQPGEFLYSVKTGVSEKVLALTLFSDQAKAEYQINLAQLRLQETETAAAQDKLNDQTSAEVRQLFNDHVTDIQNNIIKINAKEDARVSLRLNSQLEALLKAHAKIIDNLAEKKQGSQAAAIKNILSDLKDKTDEITKNREQSESNVSVAISSNSKINAENKVKEAQAAVAEAGAAIGAAAVSESVRQKALADLAIASHNMIDGKAKLESQDYAGAFILLQNAVRLAQEVNIYISSESRLELKFNSPAALSVPLKLHTINN